MNLQVITYERPSSNALIVQLQYRYNAVAETVWNKVFSSTIVGFNIM